MSSNIEEIIAEMDSEMIKKKFETLQKKQEREEMQMKLNQQRTDQIKSMVIKIKSLEENNIIMEEKYKLIENQIKNLKKENEELKKQIQTKSEETETVSISRDNINDIWDAIERGSLLAVKFYYKDNPENIIKEHASQSTAIHCASEFGNLHIIEFLISKGVEFDKIDSKGNTPLICASLGGHLSVINYLLDKGPQINHQNNNKKTALLIAVENNQFDIVKLLIDKGANKIGLLHIAYKKGYFDIFKFLLSTGADIDEIDSEGCTPLMRAVEGNNLDIVQLLIEKGANNVGALYIAYKNDYFDIFKFLLSKGARIEELDSESCIPLIWAVEGNNLDIVKLLIDKGDNKAGALHLAYKKGFFDIFKFLLSDGAEIEELDSEGFTPLMRAVEGNNLNIVQLLIENGANNVGALHIAHKKGFFDIFKILLSNGAEIDEIDSEGFTPLMRAVEGNNFDIVKLLIDKGANKAGALHIASKSRYSSIIEFLLSDGAEIDEIDSEGFTPLMRAVEENKFNCSTSKETDWNKLNIVKVLINKGANKMLKNKLNQTAKDLAYFYQTNYCSRHYGYYSCVTCNSIVKLLS